MKFGALRGPDGRWGGVDARPSAVKNFAAYSLKRLGVDVIDIYRPARLDPAVPIEDTIGAIADLIKPGYVRHIGLSEVGVETIRRAHGVHPIVDLQIEYSLASRAPEEKIFPALAELGISATLYGVLSRGLLSGSKPERARGLSARTCRASPATTARRTRPSWRGSARFAEARGRYAGAALHRLGAREAAGVRAARRRENARRSSRTCWARSTSPSRATELARGRGARAERSRRGHPLPAAQMAHLDSER